MYSCYLFKKNIYLYEDFPLCSTTVLLFKKLLWETLLKTFWKSKQYINWISQFLCLKHFKISEKQVFFLQKGLYTNIVSIHVLHYLCSLASTDVLDAY